YQTNNTPGLYYYEAGWNAVTSKSANKNLSNLSAPTAVNVDLLPGTNNSTNLGSSSSGWKDLYLTGRIFLNDSVFVNKCDGYSTFVGLQSGSVNTGYYNSAFGYQALYSNTTGSLNAAIGIRALYYNTSGSTNTASGTLALYANTNGFGNTANGSEA